MAVTTTTALLIAATAASAYGTIQAGKAQKAASTMASRQAEADARTATVERKRALIKTLAEQNVGAAAQGRTISSISALQSEDLRRASYDETLIKGGAAAQVSANTAAGKAAMNQAYTKAAGTLLSGGYQYSKTSAPKAD